ncbi:MAG TPA: NAD(P)-dependent oxidoreductase, partial [Porticoccaceae bacterium]|nr:NAD(P)-dependent oxidoreductase [Porticoccaceae bacterium]
MARVLIVGCGDIGLGLARTLLAEGHAVTAVKRNPLTEAVAGLAIVLADVSNPASIKGLPTVFDQIFVILT